MYCIYCGALLRDDAKYCRDCGKPVEPEKIPKEPEKPKRWQGAWIELRVAKDYPWTVPPGMTMVKFVLVGEPDCPFDILMEGKSFALDGKLTDADLVKLHIPRTKEIMDAYENFLWMLDFYGKWEEATPVKEDPWYNFRYRKLVTWRVKRQN